MLESIEKKKVVDVCNYVQLLRSNRISMVQTEVSIVNFVISVLKPRQTNSSDKAMQVHQAFRFIFRATSLAL